MITALANSRAARLTCSSRHISQVQRIAPSTSLQPESSTPNPLSAGFMKALQLLPALFFMLRAADSPLTVGERPPNHGHER
jgi:hypothetical protein